MKPEGRNTSGKKHLEAEVSLEQIERLHRSSYIRRSAERGCRRELSLRALPEHPPASRPDSGQRPSWDSSKKSLQLCEMNFCIVVPSPISKLT